MRLVAQRRARNTAPTTVFAALATAVLLTLAPATQAQGAASTAIDQLDRENPGDRDLLYHLERGELLRLNGAYEDSRGTLLKADETVRLWEEDIKVNGAKILGDIGAYILNDTTRRYEGRDYEKVMLSVRLALDHLALGDWDKARIEIKKMHEREAVIAEFRAKEMDAAKSAAESKGIKTTSFKELNGYPIETLEDPAVRALKNSYESAFANYLAGFIYEAQGESSLAAAGYRKAAEMRPGDSALEGSLAGLDKRIASARKNRGTVDTLIVVESGSPPEIGSVTLPILLPIISRGGLSMVSTPISWPVIRPADTSGVPSVVAINDKDSPLSLLTNVDLMSRRALSDEMPGVIFRTSVRAITKGMAQKAVQDNAGSFGMFGAVLSVAASVVSVATEKADTRSWRSIPGFYSVTRVSLPAGSNRIAVRTPTGMETREVQLSGPYAVVTLRTSSGGLTLAQTPYVAPPVPAVASAPAEIIASDGKATSSVAPAKAAKRDKKG